MLRLCVFIAVVTLTVAGRDGPVRISVVPEHLADFPNFIRLGNRRSVIVDLLGDQVCVRW